MALPLCAAPLIPSLGRHSLARKTRDFTDAELAAYSDKHLLYEIRMLIGCADLIACKFASGEQSTAWAFSNARVEAFAIHVRNIVDFLYPRKDKPQDTDVSAWDFLADRTSLGKIPDSLNDARRRADKEVGHLTTSRRDDDDRGKPWPLELVVEVFGVLLKFVQVASPEKLGIQVREFVLNTGK